MLEEKLDISILDNCRISIVKGRGCRCEEETNAAVIEINGDISPIMPYLSRTVETCGYNPKAKVCAFRLGSHGVVMNADKITIVDATEEKTAHEFLIWLKDKVKSAG